MKKVFSVLLALLVTVPVMAQSWGPLTLPQPTAADNGKALTYSSTLRQAVWSALSAAMVANGSEGQILRSGASAPAWTTATWPATTTANQLLYSSATNTVGGLTSANSAVLATNGSGVPAWGTSIATGITPVTVAATGSLTAAQVNGSLITNYGQGAAATLTLPAAASGYNFIVVVSTTGYALHIKAGASDKLYLDGVALDDGDKASLAVPALGNTLTCFTFQTGASAYDWICTGGGGAAWTDGGA